MRTFKHNDLDRPFKPGDMLTHTSLHYLMAEFVDYTPCGKPYDFCRECLTSQMQLKVKYSKGSFIEHCTCSTDLDPLPYLRWRKYKNI